MAVILGESIGVDNAYIAEQLESFAALLDLSGASTYATRAFRRAAELIREFRAAALAGRLREAPGVGPETERKILAGLERKRPARRRGLLLNRARAFAE